MPLGWYDAIDIRMPMGLLGRWVYEAVGVMIPLGFMVAIRLFADTRVENRRSHGGGVLDHVLANTRSNTRHVFSHCGVLVHCKQKTNLSVVSQQLSED